MPSQDDFEEDVINEAGYIFNRLVNIKDSSNFLMKEDVIRQKLILILGYLRKDYLDVPMIAKYRKYEYQNPLEEDDIWLIS